MFKEILSGAGEGIKALGSTIRKAAFSSEALSGTANMAAVVALVTWSATPAFSSSLVGLGKAALVGIGTALGGSLGSVAGMIGGTISAAMTGGALGLLTTPFIKRPDDKVDAVLNAGALIATVGFFVGGLGGFCFGIVKGHELAKEAVIKHFEDKKINTSFNEAVSGKKVEIDRKNFVATIKTPNLSF